MRKYLVKVRVKGKLHSYHSISASWYEAFETALEQFGVKAVVTVRPA